MRDNQAHSKKGWCLVIFGSKVVLLGAYVFIALSLPTQTTVRVSELWVPVTDYSDERVSREPIPYRSKLLLDCIKATSPKITANRRMRLDAVEVEASSVHELDMCYTMVKECAGSKEVYSAVPLEIERFAQVKETTIIYWWGVVLGGLIIAGGVWMICFRYSKYWLGFCLIGVISAGVISYIKNNERTKTIATVTKHPFAMFPINSNNQKPTNNRHAEQYIASLMGEILMRELKTCGYVSRYRVKISPIKREVMVSTDAPRELVVKLFQQTRQELYRIYCENNQ